MFGIITKVFIVLLTTIVNAFKGVSLSNQKYEIQPTLINLHRYEYNQELHCYPFVVKLDRCVGSCNTPNGLSHNVCVPNKTEDLNIHIFNMITSKNESNILTKNISCQCKCKFHGRKSNSNQKWNDNKCRCECKKYHVCEKDYTWNPATCSCKNGKYLASIIDNDSVILCDEIIEERKAIPTNFNEGRATC